VEQDTSNRALSGLLARLGGGRIGGQDSARSSSQPGLTGNGSPAPTGPDKSISTKAFSRFLAALKHRDAPVLLDLGPVVGGNINYFGERLGCKFFIEDVYANLEKFARENRSKELGEFFKSRFPQADGSFDGILCWDIFDYLDKNSAQVLAREMTRLLKPGGALLTFFATVAMPGKEYTRYLVVDDKTFRHKLAPAARGRQQVFVNRDINLMFQGLNVSDSFLLMTRTREIVFRKPEQKQAATETSGLPETDDAGTASASTPEPGAASAPGASNGAASAQTQVRTNGASSSTSTTITTASTVTAMAASTTTTATPMGPKTVMTASNGAPISRTS
jgi:SAM-dependent methyltransferase